MALEGGESSPVSIPKLGPAAADRWRRLSGTTFAGPEPLCPSIQQTFGTGSLYDVTVRASAPPPYELPTAKYLTEALLGLRVAPANVEGLLDAAGDSISLDKAASFAEGSTQRTEQWQRIVRVLGSDAAREMCAALFWLALAVVFARGNEADVLETEAELARSWHHLCVVAGEVCLPQVAPAPYVDARDATIDALPGATVQAVYRLMVDAFDEDRAHLVKYAQPLLDKLMQLVHYEVAGFQMSVGTCREIRRKLFRRHVLDSPFLNLHDSLRREQQRELLERDHKAQVPLSFGPNGHGMDDLQVQQILDHRLEQMRQARITARLNGDHGPQHTLAPFELTVDHYNHVRAVGFARLTALTQDQDPDELKDELSAMLSIGEESPLASPSSEDDASHSRATSKIEAENRRNPKGKKQGNPDQSADLAREIGAFDGVLSATLMCRRLARQESGRREEKAAQRRQRKDSLRRSVLVEALPRKLQHRGIETCWVSPLCERLEPKVDGRRLIDKRVGENQKLSMRGPPSTAPARAASLPTLRPTQPRIHGRCGGAAEGERQDQSALRAVRSGTKTSARTLTIATPPKTPLARQQTRPSATDAVSPKFSSEKFSERARPVSTGEDNSGSASSSPRSDIGLWAALGRNKSWTNPAELRAAEMLYISQLQGMLGNSKSPPQSLWGSLKWRSLLLKRRAVEGEK